MRATSQRWLAIGATTVALAVLNLTTARADVPAQPEPTLPAVITPAPTSATAPVLIEKAVLTGSHLPQQYRRYGRITDGALNVVVIDRRDIEHSGATSLAGVLSHVPGIRLRGR